ncbi:MAG: 50S ribosomal protein L22 [Methanomicrobia archaeon]|nr:50S ribosomal protein L22 [Methanomicrobia archaeon]MCK4310577.1 50S ribosomal protein L22 [Methanomicrobia archaeon]MCK4636992.1 50S ribosomal protein L22 [Methanomicrobia archaeon]
MGYSVKFEDELKIAKTFGKNLRISPKHAREICRELREKRLSHAKKYLEEVIEMKRAVPFKRYRKKMGHKKLYKWDTGRYPVKASKRILKLLKEIESNAEYKGLDLDKLRIVHISAYKGLVIPGWIPRAYGRATPFNEYTTNIEIVVEEV